MHNENEFLENLKRLLIEHSEENKLTERCFATLNDSSSYIASVRTSTVEDLRLMYAFQDKVKNPKQEPVEGRSELVTAIERESCDEVVLIHAGTDKKRYTIFTTPAKDRIIGILSIPEMPQVSPENVRTLLHNHAGSSQFAKECLKILDNIAVRTRSSGRVPLVEIRGTYTIRDKLNRERGNPIGGMEELVKSLKQATGEWVEMIRVEGARRYLIFATPERDRLFGVLSFPEK